MIKSISNLISKNKVSFFILIISISFSLMADINITSGAGDIVLPAGGGTATAVGNVNHTGKITGANGNGNWTIDNSGELVLPGSTLISLEDTSGGTVINNKDASISVGDDFAIMIYHDGTIINDGEIRAGNDYAAIIDGVGAITNNGTISSVRNIAVGVIRGGYN